MSRLAGIEQFRRQLERLDRKMRNKVIRQALRDGAKVVAGAVKGRAPAASGRLKRSVKVRTGNRKKDRISMVVIVTGGHDTPMVAAVEYGTKTQSPRPFIRPGFDATKGPVLGQMLGSIRRGIEEAGR